LKSAGWGNMLCENPHTKLELELEKQQLLNEQQAQEIIYLRGLVDSLLKKENS
jgi:hypothetical protein